MCIIKIFQREQTCLASELGMWKNTSIQSVALFYTCPICFCRAVLQSSLVEAQRMEGNMGYLPSNIAEIMNTPWLELRYKMLALYGFVSGKQKLVAMVQTVPFFCMAGKEFW